VDSSKLKMQCRYRLRCICYVKWNWMENEEIFGVNDKV